MRRLISAVSALAFLAAKRVPPALAILAAAFVSPALAADDAGRALAERGAWKQLRARVTASSATPADAEGLCLLSMVRMAFGDPKQALDLAEQAVRLDPRSAACHLQLAEVCGQMAQKAGILKAMGLGKRFKKEAEAAAAFDPNLIDARVDLMMFYLKAPGIAGGDKRKAAAQVEEITRIDPIQGHFARGRMALEQRDTARAEESYRRATEAGPNHFEAQASAAGFYASRRRWDLCERYARAALALDGKRAGPYAVLVMAQAQQRQWPELDATLAAAEAAVPDNFGPYYQAGRVLVTNRIEPARAERFLRKYLTIEPEGFSPTHAHARWRLAQALEQQGRIPEAIAELETALKAKPDLDDAKKDLKRLRQGKSVANKE